ncbi:MAG: hypothetical protein CSA05_00335, partial [Bacteroidia bacterium]
MNQMLLNVLFGVIAIPIAYVILRLIFKKSMMFKFSLYMSLFVIFVAKLGNIVGILDNPIFGIAAMIIDIIVGSLLFAYFNKTMRVPLDTSISKLIELSRGNLDVPVSHTMRKDEFGVLNNTILEIKTSQKQVISLIKEQLESLNNSSTQLNNTAQQLSDGASEQASSIEEVSATIEEAVANVENNTENSRRTLKKSSK